MSATYKEQHREPTLAEIQDLRKQIVAAEERVRLVYGAYAIAMHDVVVAKQRYHEALRAAGIEDAL